MAGNWTAFLPEAQKWVSARYSVLYGHPHKKKKAKKIRLHRAHVHNAMIAHGTHPGPSVGAALTRADRRSGAYKRFRVGKG